MADRLPDQLRLMASTYPDKVAYRNLDDGSSITFIRWERESNRLARGLQGRGVGKGDLVAIYLEADQILDWIVAYSAVHKLGAVAVPMNNRLSPPEVRGILEHAEVSGHRRQRCLRGGRRPTAGFAVLADWWWRRWGRREARSRGRSTSRSSRARTMAPSRCRIDDDDLADVMYTSGTTGRPKGVAVRHGNVALLPNSATGVAGDDLAHRDPGLHLCRARVHLQPDEGGHDRAVPAQVRRRDDGSRSSSTSGPVIAFVVPAMARLLIHHPRFESADLSSLTRLILGSAPLAPDTLLRLQARLPGAAVLNSYGMTEGGHATFSMDPKGSRTRPGAVGRPRPPVEVRIVDDEGADRARSATSARSSPATRAGHREYYKDPEATARMWEGGWLHTGDLGYLDADGYLYIVGRKKEMIVRGGMNVYADDVEAVLHRPPGGGRGGRRRRSPRRARRGRGRLRRPPPGRGRCRARSCSDSPANDWPTTRCRARSPSSPSCRGTPAGRW